jgi:hypothetical protein
VTDHVDTARRHTAVQNDTSTQVMSGQDNRAEGRGNWAAELAGMQHGGGKSPTAAGVRGSPLCFVEGKPVVPPPGQGGAVLARPAKGRRPRLAHAPTNHPPPVWGGSISRRTKGATASSDSR